MITKSQLADLIKLARVGAVTIGERTPSAMMVKAWNVIAETEQILLQPEPHDQPLPPEQK